MCEHLPPLLHAACSYQNLDIIFKAVSVILKIVIIFQKIILLIQKIYRHLERKNNKINNMDYKKDTNRHNGEKDILYSQTVKAGKRIYYLDVKCSKRNELFLSVTESKKIAVDGGEEGSFNFEKHKIFLYQEDFGKFIDAFSNAVRYIHEHNAEYEVNPLVQSPATKEENVSPCVEGDEQPAVTPDNTEEELPNEIKIDIDF